MAKTKTYKITIDHNLSLKEAIKGYTFKNDRINSINFPDQQTSKEPKEITLFNFGCSIHTHDVLKKLDDLGYRPANLYELLALDAQHKDIPRKYWLVALGSPWTDPWGDRFVPYLGGGESWRGLNLNWFERGWDGDWRFAATKHKVKI